MPRQPDSETGPDLQREIQKPEVIGENPEEKTQSDTPADVQPTKSATWDKLVEAFFWAPPWCRWDKDNPPEFGYLLNLLFAFASTFTVCWKSMPMDSEIVSNFNLLIHVSRSRIFTMLSRCWILWRSTLMSHMKRLLWFLLVDRRVMPWG